MPVVVLVLGHLPLSLPVAKTAGTCTNIAQARYLNYVLSVITSRSSA